MNQLAASLGSSHSPLQGMSTRSSWADFLFFKMEAGRVKIDITNHEDPNAISFDLKVDQDGTDELIQKDAKNGDTVTLRSGKKYYIANPKGAGIGSFTANFTFVP